MASWLKALGSRLTDPATIIGGAQVVASGGTSLPLFLAQQGLSTVSDYEQQRQREKLSRRQKQAQAFANLQQAVSPSGKRYEPVYSVPKLSLIGKAAGMAKQGIGAYQTAKGIRQDIEDRKLNRALTKAQTDKITQDTIASRFKMQGEFGGSLAGDATTIEGAYKRTIPVTVDSIGMGAPPESGGREFDGEMQIGDLRDVEPKLLPSGVMRGIATQVAKNVGKQDQGELAINKHNYTIAQDYIKARAINDIELTQNDFDNDPEIKEVYANLTPSQQSTITQTYFGASKNALALRAEKVAKDIKKLEEIRDNNARISNIVEDINASENPTQYWETIAKSVGEPQRFLIATHPELSDNVKANFSLKELDTDWFKRLTAGHALQAQLALYEATFLAAAVENNVGATTKLTQYIPWKETVYGEEGPFTSVSVLDAMRGTLSSALRDAVETGVMTEEDRAIWMAVIPNPTGWLGREMKKFETVNDMSKSTMATITNMARKEGYNLRGFIGEDGRMLGVNPIIDANLNPSNPSVPGVKGLTVFRDANLQSWGRSVNKLEETALSGDEDWAPKSINFLLNANVIPTLNPEVISNVEEMKLEISAYRLEDLLNELKNAKIDSTTGLFPQRITAIRKLLQTLQYPE